MAEVDGADNSGFGLHNADFGRNPIASEAGGRALTHWCDIDGVLMDFNLVSATNIQGQLVREIREGILNPDAVDFGGKGLFELPYYRTSWPLYREYFNSAFADDFEKRFGLDPSIEVKW